MNALWLALWFHRLPIEVFEASEEPAVTAVQHCVVSGNQAADELGITAGMRLSGALGIAPDLRIHERSLARETTTMEGLACWLGNFSPHVSVSSPDFLLLLEIGGCLRLFNGLKTLCKRLSDGVQAQGFSIHMAVAPTPMAAQWFARAGQKGCLQPEHLKSYLAVLPVEVMSLSSAERSVLASFGIRFMHELMALPRAGIARRLGVDFSQRLDQVLGETPDFRTPFVFPETFLQKLELPAKVESSSMLLFATRRLLASLSGWLAARSSGINECTLWLTHERQPPTRLILAFSGATRDVERMERVTRERLAHFEIPAPVTDIALEVKESVELPGQTAGLFAESSAGSLEPVIERLRARLGQEAIHGISVREDYRPECATRYVAAAREKFLRSGPPRPFWLLPKPLPIQEREGRLFHEGLLERVAGPERIESGWWDGSLMDRQAGSDASPAVARGGSGIADVRRDYYVAFHEDGRWLWIFRDTEGWWLHGLFA